MTTKPITLPRAPVVTGFIDEEFELAYPAGIERHFWNNARNRIVHRLLRRQMADQAGPCIEIGCGTGIVTDFLRKKGIDCIGVDVSNAPPCNTKVAPHLHLGVDAADLPRRVRVNARYVLMLDVLEHLKNPNEFLSKCHGLFPNLKGLLFTVPARMEIWSNYDNHFRHFKRYNHDSISEVYRDSQFSLIDWGYFFHALYPPALLMRLLRRARKTRLAAPVSVLWHSMLARAFSLEQLLLPRRLPGTSLYGMLSVVRLRTLQVRDPMQSITRSRRPSAPEPASVPCCAVPPP